MSEDEMKFGIFAQSTSLASLLIVAGSLSGCSASDTEPRPKVESTKVESTSEAWTSAGAYGERIEVQIRTHEMHRVSLS